MEFNHNTSVGNKRIDFSQFNFQSDRPLRKAKGQVAKSGFNQKPIDRVASYIAIYSPDAESFAISTGLSEGKAKSTKVLSSYLAWYMRKYKEEGIQKVLQIHPDFVHIKEAIENDIANESDFSGSSSTNNLLQKSNAVIAWIVAFKKQEAIQLLNQFFSVALQPSISDTDLIQRLYAALAQYPERNSLILALYKPESSFSGESEMAPAIGVAAELGGKIIGGAFDMVNQKRAAEAAAQAQGVANIRDAGAQVTNLRASKLQFKHAAELAAGKNKTIMMIAGGVGAVLLLVTILIIVLKK